MVHGGRWGLAATALLLAGCASDRQVYVDVPISRMELPENGPRGFDVTPAGVGTTRMQLTPDQTTTAPDTSHPVFKSGDAMGQLKLEASPARVFSVALKGNEIGWGGQAKLLPLEPVLRDGPLALALTFNYLEGDHNFDYDQQCFFGCSGPAAHTHVHSNLHDYALILGLKVAPTAMLYGGAYASELRYSGNFASTGTTPSSMTFADRINSRGGNLGLALQFGHWGRLLGEYSRAGVHSGLTNDRVGAFGLALEVFFGPRLKPEAFAGTARAVAEPIPRRAAPRAEAAPATGPYVSVPATPYQPGETRPLRHGAGLRPRPTTDASILPGSDTVTGVVLVSSVRNGQGTWWYVKAGDQPGWVLESDLER